jgi:hypothetical protein
MEVELRWVEEDDFGVVNGTLHRIGPTVFHPCAWKVD